MNNKELMQKVFEETTFDYLDHDDRELLIFHAEYLFSHLEEDTKLLHMKNVATLFANYRAKSVWKEFVGIAYAEANPSNRSYEYRMKLFKSCIEKLFQLMGGWATEEATQLKKHLEAAYKKPERYVFRKGKLQLNKNELKEYLEKIKSKRDAIRDFLAAIV